MPINTDAVLITDLDRQNVRDLIQWLKTNRPDLVEQVLNPQPPAKPTLTTRMDQAKSLASSLAFVAPKSLHGGYHVTPELEKSATATAVVMSASNWIDTLGNFPVFFFAFKSLTFFPAALMAIALSMPALVAGNALSAVVAQGHKGRWKLAIAALMLGLIPLNVLQTVATGIGIEVINNQPELAQMAAGQALDRIVASKQEQLQAVEDNAPREIQECRQERQALEAMPRTTPFEEKAFQSRYVRLFGTFASQAQPMTLPLAQLPLCVRANTLEQNYEQSVQQSQAAFHAFNLERQTLGNDLAFLKQVAPSQYDKTFVEKSPWFFLPSDPTVEVRSGVTLVTLGTQSFMGKVQRGDWDQLGMNLFFVGLSAITSLTSIGMGVTFALSQDTQKSYDDHHKEKVSRFFQRARMTLSQLHDEQQRQLDNSEQFGEVADGLGRYN
jgi:hypothetical protein